VDADALYAEVAKDRAFFETSGGASLSLEANR